MSALITVDRATLGYGRHVVLSDLSFEISNGDFLGFVGPNGGGKTTILRAILGSLSPLAGSVTVQPGVRFGYVPQRESVSANFPLSVLDVVMMGRFHRVGLGRRPGAADHEAAIQALDHVGIGDLADRRLNTLSGGQIQRTLIARALVGDPTVLVLDEPTNGTDLVSTTQILGLVRELHEQDQLTVLMASHALNDVASYVKRIALVLEGGFRVGDVQDIMTEETLSSIYGIPVDVERLDGHRIVLARPRGTQGNPGA